MSKSSKRPAHRQASRIPSRAPVVHVLDEKIIMKRTPYVEGVKEGIRHEIESRQRRRHRPKSDPAIEILRHLYPPEGKPLRNDVSDFELERAYHDECDRRRMHKTGRASHTQLLRCAGRRK
jgi:hypothetical protein